MRKNALFAGCDEGAANWACVASMIETGKLNGFDPEAYLPDVLSKLINLWPVSSIDELMPGRGRALRTARSASEPELRPYTIRASTRQPDCQH